MVVNGMIDVQWFAIMRYITGLIPLVMASKCTLAKASNGYFEYTHQTIIQVITLTYKHSPRLKPKSHSDARSRPPLSHPGSHSAPPPHIYPSFLRLAPTNHKQALISPLRSRGVTVATSYRYSPVLLIPFYSLHNKQQM